MAKYLGQTSRFLDLERSEGEFKVVVITFWSGNPLRKLYLSITKQPFVSSKTSVISRHLSLPWVKQNTQYPKLLAL